MINALTVDVEDYFHVTAFENHVQRKRWNEFPLRVVENTNKILDIFEECGVKATFFVLGWVARTVPSLVREIHSRGHEIACHGFGHELVYRIGHERFREDVKMAKGILEDLVGTRINGYRAPSYSIVKESLWALEVLVEEGFSYDSSIFPVFHDIYGMPGAPRFPSRFTTASGPITEFPLSTYCLRAVGKEYRCPISGGGYLRLFPVRFIRQGIMHINNKELQPTVLYFHPWELDPDQPRIKAGMKSCFRHYVNLHRTEKKLRFLLDSVRYGAMEDVLSNLNLDAALFPSPALAPMSVS